MAARGRGLVGILLALIINVAALATATLQLFFNISFIAASLNQYFPNTIDISIVLNTINEAINQIPAINVVIPFEFTVPFAELVASVLRYLQVIRLLAQEWNCSGGTVCVALVLFAVCGKRLLGVVAGETMFKLSIKSQEKVRGSNPVLKNLFLAVTKLSVFLVFYLVQVFVFFFTNAVTEVMNSFGRGFLVPLEGCSAEDGIAWYVGIIFFTAYIVTFLILYLAVFSGAVLGDGMEPRNPFENMSIKSAIAMIIRVVREVTPTPAKIFRSLKLFFKIKPERILLLTLGVWTPEMCSVYEIKEKAEKYDPDSEDDDNSQELVMTLLARSYSLLYIAFPGCVILAKVQEAMNHSPVWARGAGISLYTSFPKRAFFWLFYVLRLVTMLYILFNPDVLMAGLMVGSLVPPFLFSVISDLREATATVSPNQVAPTAGSAAQNVDMAKIKGISPKGDEARASFSLA